ncbi:unnamed protein product [Anisakis simplex]|uniref:Protein SHQ1 homolog n=1 Tax=Anisakis simplex TaxID=6269 RepID=A0A0M3KJ72_ANISI|nr:unnamed protein product [Anisakis simplex]
MLDIDDIIELVDLIAENLYEHTDELPSKILLNIVGELLKKLVNETEYLNERDFPKRSSPTHLRVVIRRLIQTKHLPEEYRSLCFMLSALLVCLLDFHWFESDPQFVVLLAALTDVQIRMVLDNPKLIKIEELIECATLGESFIECVELGEFLDDER